MMARITVENQITRAALEIGKLTERIRRAMLDIAYSDSSFEKRMLVYDLRRLTGKLKRATDGMIHAYKLEDQDLRARLDATKQPVVAIKREMT